jgi:hypothetical protein
MNLIAEMGLIRYDYESSHGDIIINNCEIINNV